MHAPCVVCRYVILTAPQLTAIVSDEQITCKWPQSKRELRRRLLVTIPRAKKAIVGDLLTN